MSLPAGRMGLGDAPLRPVSVPTPRYMRGTDMRPCWEETTGNSGRERKRKRERGREKEKERERKGKGRERGQELHSSHERNAKTETFHAARVECEANVLETPPPTHTHYEVNVMIFNLPSPLLPGYLNPISVLAPHSQ